MCLYNGKQIQFFKRERAEAETVRLPHRTGLSARGEAAGERRPSRGHRGSRERGLHRHRRTQEGPSSAQAGPLPSAGSFDQPRRNFSGKAAEEFGNKLLRWRTQAFRETAAGAVF